MKMNAFTFPDNARIVPVLTTDQVGKLGSLLKRMERETTGREKAAWRAIYDAIDTAPVLEDCSPFLAEAQKQLQSGQSMLEAK